MGKAAQSVDPVKRLSEFLRDDMGLSATKLVAMLATVVRVR